MKAVFDRHNGMGSSAVEKGCAAGPALGHVTNKVHMSVGLAGISPEEGGHVQACGPAGRHPEWQHAAAVDLSLGSPPGTPGR